MVMLDKLRNKWRDSFARLIFYGKNAKINDMKILENVPISEMTTMRLGGPARYVIDVLEEEDAVNAFDFARERNLPVFVLGGGANTIAHDAGFDGVIIRNAMTGITEQNLADGAGTTESGPLHITILGGTEWDSVVEYTSERGLTGIEALSKIPGRAGAAPVQNIGAYGQEIADSFVSCRVYDIKAREFKTLYKADMRFSYRHSILNTTESGRYFVISVRLRLEPGQMARPFYKSVEKYIAEHGATDFSPAGIRKIVSAIRADKLPDPRKKASAGSFFKNIYLSEAEAVEAEAKGYPVYHGHDGLKINSAWLIEQCGLKGKLLYGMRVNDKAPLVLINESATGYADLAAARAEIVAAVKAKFGYTLEQEPVELATPGQEEVERVAPRQKEARR